MEYQWDASFQEIGLVFEPKIVRVRTDVYLAAYLAAGKRRAALQLAKYARTQYALRFGKELRIGERSLACEIYWHYYIWKKASATASRHGGSRLTSWLLLHMDVIDCGERDVDNNRFLWDLLSAVF